MIIMLYSLDSIPYYYLFRFCFSGSRCPDEIRSGNYRCRNMAWDFLIDRTGHVIGCPDFIAKQIEKRNMQRLAAEKMTVNIYRERSIRRIRNYRVNSKRLVTQDRTKSAISAGIGSGEFAAGNIRKNIQRTRAQISDDSSQTDTA